MTWDEMETHTVATYSGDPDADVNHDSYRRGIHTAFNVMRCDYPNVLNVCKQAESLRSALEYMSCPENWDDETGYLKRPGGARQEGIVLYSALIMPWVFAAQFVNRQLETAALIDKTWRG